MDDRFSAPDTLSARRRPSPRLSLQPRRVALIGNFPPRRCGIATFTADLHAALTEHGGMTQADIYAMTESGARYAYPAAVRMAIDQNDPVAYAEAARRINASGAEVVSLQHEYGIFGGAAGAMLLPTLNALKAPIITTLHTVLERPDADQRRVMQDVIALSSRVIVMAEKGRDILRRVYNVPASRIVVTPHGAPDMAREPADGFKTQFGWDGRRVLLTFGLLSPNKGIEHMLAALPAIVRDHPDALYVVLGATHPHLHAREGETYRDMLIARAKALGVADHVQFIDAFVDNDSLFSYLRATDVYVTPYLHEAQITSGTLAYAIALGRAVVSTPYWHAREALADGRGLLCPFADADALARAIGGLLADDAARESLASRAYAMGRDTIWSSVARRYAETFAAAREAQLERPRHRPTGGPLRLPQVNLAGVEALTDDRGIIQHTVFSVPDRAHGYCLDDAARALILMNDAHSAGFSAPVQRLARGYAAFVQHAWNEDVGAFRNFMSFDGRWLEPKGSGDSYGRAVWAIGSTALRGPNPALRAWACSLAGRILPHVGALEAPRSRALAMLGLVGMIGAHAHAEPAWRVLQAFAADLHARFRGACSGDWRWFEGGLAYDNARLSEALLRAATVLADAQMAECALASLRWLCAMQTADEGWFRPVGSEALGSAQPSRFDQQPLEAAATIDACRAAHDMTNDVFWVGEARRAYEWYLGVNDLGLSLVVPEEGVCHDGLTPFDVNRNQGAESVIAFQAATCAMHAMVRDRGGAAAAPRAS